MKKSKLLSLLMITVLILSSVTVYAEENEVSIDTETNTQSEILDNTLYTETQENDTNIQLNTDDSAQINTEESSVATEETPVDTEEIPVDSKESITNEDNTQIDENVAEDTEPLESKETPETDEQLESSDEQLESNESTINEEGNTEEIISNDTENIDETEKQDKEVITKYIIDETVTEDTVIREYVTEDGITIVEIATPPLELNEEENSISILDHFELTAETTEAPSLDNNSWTEYASYYDNNSGDSNWSAAQWGAWGGNGDLQGQTYDDPWNNDLSNEFKLYTDGQNVHLYIQYAAIFNGTGNGNDYNFNIDGENTKYRVVLDNGNDLTWSSLEPGTYNLMVLNDNGDISGQQVLGAKAQIVVKEGNLHNEMEVVIPLEAMKAQNGAINIDQFSTVAFNTPNLMKGEISCAGASSGSTGFIIITFIFFAITGICFKKKENFKLAMV